jgi:predicted enzyme involved in methoxymalonyl-ACP biosynthesis
LNALRASRDHLLLVTDLADRYGASGTIGLALIERGAHAWKVMLLIVSCRVISRGVGRILLGHILRSAKQAGVRLLAEFVPNNRNRMMYITYKFNGFVEVSEQDGVIVLEHPLDTMHPLPPYITVNAPDEPYSTTSIAVV